MTDRELIQQWMRPGAIVPVDMNTVRILLDALRERLADSLEQNALPTFIVEEAAAELRRLHEFAESEGRWASDYLKRAVHAETEAASLRDQNTELDRKLALVAAAERDACADVCEGHYDTAQAARAIRARGGKT